MAKQDQKSRKGKVGFAGVHRAFINKVKLVSWMIWTDVNGWFGNYTKEPIGIRIGASVTNAQISVNVLMENGSDVTVAMNVEGARQIISELNKAIDMVRFKGR